MKSISSEKLDFLRKSLRQSANFLFMESIRWRTEGIKMLDASVNMGLAVVFVGVFLVWDSSVR